MGPARLAGARLPGGAPSALAFVVVIVLWGLIAATLVAFWKQHRLAGILLLPYLAWVAVASALTHSVWQRNPALLG